MKNGLTDILQTEMSRKEFLTTLGYGAASLVGLAGVLRMLGHKGLIAHKTSSSQGYGGSSYGR